MSERSPHLSGGRGTGFAGPQAQRPPWGAESDPKCANVGVMKAAAPGRPKQGRPPRGAKSDTQCANVGVMKAAAPGKLRTETASIIMKTTEHAAQSLVGQQQETLQKAAVQAMQGALNEQVLKRSRRDWLMAAAVGAAAAVSVTLAMLALRSLLT